MYVINTWYNSMKYNNEERLFWIELARTVSQRWHLKRIIIIKIIQAKKVSGKGEVKWNSKCKISEVENDLVWSKYWQKECVTGTQWSARNNRIIWVRGLGEGLHHTRSMGRSLTVLVNLMTGFVNRAVIWSDLHYFKHLF